MSRSRSLTAKSVILERYEIQALIDWHHEEMFRAGDKLEYSEADDHKCRSEQLSEELKTEPVKNEE